MNKIESTFDDGYDSDGQIGPFNYVEILEGSQDFDEDAVSESTDLLQDPNILEPTNDVDTQNVEESSSVPILDETKSKVLEDHFSYSKESLRLLSDDILLHAKCRKWQR